MHDLSDEELDGLFKEAAENHHVLHDTEAWQEIASRLDNEAVPAGASGYLKWIIPTVLLLAITGGVLVWQSRSNAPAQVAPPVQVSAPETNQASHVPPPQEKPSATAAEDKAVDKGSASTATTQNPTAIVPEEKTNHSQIQQERPVHQETGIEETAAAGTVENEPSLKSTSRPAVSSSQQDELATVIPVPSQKPSDSKPAIDPDRESKVDTSFSQAQPHVYAPVSDLSTTDSISNRVTIVDSALTADKIDSATVADERKKANPGKRLYLQLGISPDFSSVNYFKPGAMGVNAGLSIGYRFGQRWSTQLSAVWAKKIYNTKDVESYGYNGYNLKVEALDGNCRVLDLSANIHYDIVQRQRSALFVGAGLSSYMMMAEDYRYWCMTPSGKGPYPYDQHLRHKNNDWFKMLDLSFGIERQLARSVSIQAEPFIKAPLAGVGEGKISLVSAGAFFNLKWMIK